MNNTRPFPPPPPIQRTAAVPAGSRSPAAHVQAMTSAIRPAPAVQPFMGGRAQAPHVQAALRAHSSPALQLRQAAPLPRIPQPGGTIQCDKFKVGGTLVTGWASYHTKVSRDSRSNNLGRGGLPVSQTTEEIMSHAMAVINSGMAEFVEKGGASGLDDIVMVDGALFGVHPPSTGGRQIYPIYRARMIPTTNQYGGFTGSFTYDSHQRAEGTHLIYRPPNSDTTAPMDI